MDAAFIINNFIKRGGEIGFIINIKKTMKNLVHSHNPTLKKLV